MPVTKKWTAVIFQPGHRDPSSFVRRKSGVETCIQPEPFTPESGDRLTIFCFLFRFSGGQPDWPTSFKQGLEYFHQRVVNSVSVSRQSFVLWPDAGHGVRPASSRLQWHPANWNRAFSPTQAFWKKGNLCCSYKTLELGMSLIRHRKKSCRPPGPYPDVPFRPSLPKFS